MNYEDFKNKLEAELNKIADPDRYSVMIQSMLKNNGQRLDGAVIKEKESNIAPVIYLDSLYDEFLSGKSIEEIANETFHLAGRSMNNISPDAIPKMNWDSIKNRLYVSVINADANAELLADTPHRRVEDLAVIPKIHIEGDMLGNGTIRVTNEMLGRIEKTKDEVLNRAIENTNNLSFNCRNIFDVIKDSLGDENEMMEDLFCDAQEPPMYVVTLPDGIDGASILACRNALDYVVEGINDDVYILPSSTDEVLLIPKSSGVDVESLSEMVYSVNRSEVAPSKILSDNVYQFDRAVKKVKIATSAEEEHIPIMGKSKHMAM